MEDVIKLKTKEGTEIEITKKAGELSELIKGAINDYPNEQVLPLGEVDEKMAEKVKEFLMHYNGTAPAEIEKPLTSSDMSSVTDNWSADFINKLPLEDLVNLTTTANYMGISCLLDLCCAKVASLCKDKSE